MNKTIYQLREINVKEFDRKTNSLIFSIRFSKNDTLDEIDVPWNMSNIPNLVNEVLLKIKQRDKIIVESDSDDFLDNIYIIRIANEEMVEERMLDFFRRLTERIRGLKHERNTKIFMSVISDVKHQKLTF